MPAFAAGNDGIWTGQWCHPGVATGLSAGTPLEAARTARSARRTSEGRSLVPTGTRTAKI